VILPVLEQPFKAAPPGGAKTARHFRRSTAADPAPIKKLLIKKLLIKKPAYKNRDAKTNIRRDLCT
jgi:hypothetical protein